MAFSRFRVCYQAIEAIAINSFETDLITACAGIAEKGFTLES